MEIKTVGILGCGLMGSGIAQVCAAAGYKTIVREVEEGFLEKGMGRIEKFLADGVAKGKVTADAQATTLGNLSGTTKFDDLKLCDLIIEAIVENVDEKTKTFAALDAVVTDQTIFCSNTSSLCIMELAARTKRPDRFAGLHFFNPVPLMKLVEVVRTLRTAPAVLEEAAAWCRAVGKTVVSVGDSTGFVVNRLLVPYMLDAIRVYEQGLASRDDIDNAMKLGCGYPMGPLLLGDYVGLDTTYAIAQIMFDEFREPRFAPPPLLRRMVLAGWYGKKSGKGFYDWSVNPPMPSELGL